MVTPELSALLELAFLGALEGADPKCIHALGILESPWHGNPEEPRIKDPPPELLQRLRNTGLELWAHTKAPLPDESGARDDAPSGRNVVLHYVRLHPQSSTEVEVEFVTYRHMLSASGHVARFVNGPDGWERIFDEEPLGWEA